MSEHLLRFTLADLARARVVCAKCGSANEVSMDVLKSRDIIKCPCGHDYFQDLSNPLALFGDVVGRLLENKNFTVEFLVPIRAGK